MKNMVRKCCAAALALFMLPGLMTACGQEASAPEGSAAAPSAPAVQETTERQPLKGVYARPLSLPEKDVTGTRLELMERDGRLIFRLILVYPDYMSPLEIHTARMEGDSRGFTAVYDDDFERIALSGSRDAVTVDYVLNGETDRLSGTYTPLETAPAETPVIPALETDPRSPNGRMEKHLAAAARANLALPADAVLTEADCAAVQSLDLFETEISSLQGIEYFTDLRELSVSGGYLTDLSALARLTSLERVSVSRCYVREIPDLSACTHLETLEITGCCVEDLAPVAKLPWVKALNFCDNRITSAAPLKDLKNLAYVDLSFNPILDWDAVQDNAALVQALPWDFDLALQVQNRAQEIVAETVTDDMTDLEKQIAICEKIHDIADNVEAQRPQEPDGYEVILNGRGVCGDFAQATSLLMNMAGLHVINCGSDTHEWNMIELNGTWYEFDCMWDDNRARTDWQHFDLSRAEMAAVDQEGWHQLDLLRYPIAPESMLTIEYQPE